MDAPLGLEITIRVGSLDFHGDALDSGFLSPSAVQDSVLESVLLGPAKIHAQQHLRPVLRLGAARAGMDGQNGIFGIVLV